MGYKCSLLALSPRVPRADVLNVEEGGPEAAAAAVEAFWPGRWRLAETATLRATLEVCLECLWVGTWGETVLLVNTDPYELCDDPAIRDDERGLWLLVSHEDAGLAAYRTPEAFGARDVVIDSDTDIGELASTVGPQHTLLPFEVPFRDGAHRLADGTLFKPVDLIRAALIWGFGITPPTEQLSDEVLDQLDSLNGAQIPMHRFAPVASKRRERIWLAMG